MREFECRVCGDIIGVYEPLIVIVEGEPRRTSRAAETLNAQQRDCFHANCLDVQKSSRA